MEYRPYLDPAYRDRFDEFLAESERQFAATLEARRKDPISKKRTEWVRWGDRNFSQPLLEVILDKGRPGALWPAPVISGQGVDIVFVLERKTGK